MEWELRIINFNIMGVHRKIWILEGVHEKTNIQGGGLPKTGAWTVCRFKRGLGENKGVVDTRMHTMTVFKILIWKCILGRW